MKTVNPSRSALFLLSLTLAACASRENRETTTVTLSNTATTSEPDAASPASTPEPSNPGSTQSAVVDAAVAAAARDAAAPAAVAQRPLYFDRDITDADLANRTLRELAIMRNTPYARMGHRFRRPWLSQYFSSQGWYRATRQVADNELNERDRRNAQAVGRFDTALSREALEALATALRLRDERNLLQEGDEVEAVLLSQRLGRNITITRATNRDSTPLDDPEQLENVLERRELLEMSPRDLWILRNMIYARRGRPFRSSILLEYFEGTAWYHPDNAYNDARLRRVDRQNLRMIQSVEAEIGGPTNAQSEAEMAMYGA
ncbi:MAG: YARHG domain-containing protein [Polyangiales bacterium]